MTVSGTGIGGNIGGPQQPSQREEEATATTEHNKAQLGIQPDTIEQNLTELHKETTWKYSTDSSRPSLDHPITKMRIDKDTDEELDTSWKGAYNQLVNQLPTDVKEALSKQLHLPFEMRSFVFVALNNLLTATAKTLTWISGAKIPPDPSSLAGKRTKMNQMLPLIAMQGIHQNGQGSLDGIKEFLEGVGPNWGNFDRMNHFSEQLESLLNELVGASPEQLKTIAKEVHQLNNDYHSSSFDQDLQLISPTLKALDTTLTAQTLDTASGSLQIGLNTAMKGIDTSFGQAFNKISDAIANNILPAMLPYLSESNEKMLAMLSTTLIYGGLHATTLLADEGLGVFPSKEEADQLEAKRYTFDLALHLAMNTEVVKETFYAVACACEVKEKDREIVAQTLTLISVLMMILNGAKVDEKNSEKLTESLAKQIADTTNLIAQYLEEAIIDDKIEGDQINVLLQQANIAMEKQEYDEYLKTMFGALGLLNITNEDMKTEMKKIRSSADIFVNAFTTGLEEQAPNVTGITQA